MGFTNDQRAAFDRLERSGYLPTVRDWIMHHAVPFFWHDAEGRVCHNGTLTLVDTGEAKLGVTADHVVAAYLADLEAGRIYDCQFGGALVRPERLLLDRNATLDLATFVVPDVVVPAGAAFHSALHWPPANVAGGEWLFYAGYPGAHRTPHESVIDFGLEALFSAVADVNGSSIAVRLEFGELHWPLHDGEAMNRILGGMSGGPVFRLIEEDLTRLELVGFVYEHGENFELVFARSASVVSASGKIG